MNPGIDTEICRVTVIGPRRRVDIALPPYVPFADLFPGVARFCGLDRNTLARAPGGWVLQRLGQPPFQPSATPASAGLLDGELIYLRPCAAELPEVSSDDIADEISGVHDGPDRWGPADARRIAFGAGAAALAAGVAVIARSGPPWTIPAAAAGAVAAALLVVAAAVSRAAGDAGAGALLGYAALPYAFVAGLAGAAQTAPLSRLGAPDVLAGFAMVLLAAVIAAAGVARGLPIFCGVAAAAVFGAAAAWLVQASSGMSAAGAAALTVTPALALTPLIPAAAFRMAGLSLPPVPATADELRNDSLMVPAGDVRPRAVAADRLVTGAACGLGLIGGGAEIALGLGKGGLAPVMAAVLACALLLRARLFRGRSQRLWLLIPGYGGLIWLGLAASGGRLAALAALVLGAAVVIGVGAWLPAHRPSPFWGRAADVADTVLIVSLIPLALGVAGVLGYLHGLGG